MIGLRRFLRAHKTLNRTLAMEEAIDNSHALGFMDRKTYTTRKHNINQLVKQHQREYENSRLALAFKSSLLGATGIAGYNVYNYLKSKYYQFKYGDAM